MVKVLIDGREIELERGGQVYQIMSVLGLNPEEFLALKDGRLVPDDEYVKEGDTIEFLRVTSRG